MGICSFNNNYYMCNNPILIRKRKSCISFSRFYNTNMYYNLHYNGYSLVIHSHKYSIMGHVKYNVKQREWWKHMKFFKKILNKKVRQLGKKIKL